MCLGALPVCVPHKCSAQGCEKKVSDALELEFHMVVSHHVAARN